MIAAFFAGLALLFAATGAVVGIQARARQTAAERSAALSAAAEDACAPLRAEVDMLAARLAEPPASWWGKRRRRQVLVHLLDDTTVKGVVLDVFEDGVLLGACEYLGEKSLSMAGTVFVPKERIAMTQEPPRGSK